MKRLPLLFTTLSLFSMDFEARELNEMESGLRHIRVDVRNHQMSPDAITRIEEEVLFLAQEQFASLHNRSLSSDVIPYLQRRITEERMSPRPKRRNKFSLLESTPDTDEVRKEKLEKWVSQLVIDSMQKATEGKDIELSIERVKLELAYKKEKLAIFSNLFTALITATATVITMNLSSD